MCPHASLTTYGGTLNDYIFNTAHLHLQLMHSLHKITITAESTAGAHFEFTEKCFFCQSQGLLLMQQSFGVACETAARTEVD